MKEAQFEDLDKCMLLIVYAATFERGSRSFFQFFIQTGIQDLSKLALAGFINSAAGWYEEHILAR